MCVTVIEEHDVRTGEHGVGLHEPGITMDRAFCQPHHLSQVGFCGPQHGATRLQIFVVCDFVAGWQRAWHARFEPSCIGGVISMARAVSEAWCRDRWKMKPTAIGHRQHDRRGDGAHRRPMRAANFRTR